MGFSGTSRAPSPRRAAAYCAGALDALPWPPGVSGLLCLVQQLVPGARLVRELPHELVLVLPYGGAEDGSFARLFWEVDQRLEELGLAGYGISDTSLEEVRLLEGGLPGGGGSLGGMRRGLLRVVSPSQGGGGAPAGDQRLGASLGGLGTHSVLGVGGSLLWGPRLSPCSVSPDLPEGGTRLCCGHRPGGCGHRSLSLTPNPSPELHLTLGQVPILGAV